MLLLQISSLLLFKYLGFLNLSHNFFVFWSSKVKFTNSASPTTNIAALPNIHEIIACKWFKNLIVNLKFWVYKFDADHLINGYSYRIHKINLINSNENRVSEIFKMEFKKRWCGWEDLNLHAVGHQILSLACLPISPHPHNNNKWYAHQDSNLRPTA